MMDDRNRRVQGGSRPFRDTPEMQIPTAGGPPPQTQAAVNATQPEWTLPYQRGPRVETTMPTSTPGYQAPAGSPTAPPTSSTSSAPPTVGSPATLMGFEMDKLNAGHNSPKYSFGRYFQGLGHTPQAIGSGWDAFVQQDPRFQGWTFNGKDTISYGGPPSGLSPEFNGFTSFDVINSAGLGGRGLQWNPNGPGMGGGGMGGMGGGMGYPAALMPQGGGTGMQVLNPNSMPFMGADILRYLAQQLGLQQVLGGQGF